MYGLFEQNKRVAREKRLRIIEFINMLGKISEYCDHLRVTDKDYIARSKVVGLESLVKDLNCQIENYMENYYCYGSSRDEDNIKALYEECLKITQKQRKESLDQILSQHRGNVSSALQTVATPVSSAFSWFTGKSNPLSASSLRLVEDLCGFLDRKIKALDSIIETLPPAVRSRGRLY